MKNTFSTILVIILALVIGTFVLRIFGWFMWNLFLPLVFGLIVLFVISRLIKKR